MTKEELYEEFKEVTHFDDTGLDITIQKITNIEISDRRIASGFEGLYIRFNVPQVPALTYFHKGVKMGMTNKESIDKLTENIPTWKLVLIDKWTDFKVWFWLKTHKGVDNGNDD